MTSRFDIAASARSLVGTPYRHQGRVPGARGGVDCIGVPVLVAWGLGLRPRSWNVTGYRRIPDGHELLRRLRTEFAAEVPRDRLQLGDVIVLDWGQFPHHVAVIGGAPGALTMVHADNVRREVIEHRLAIASPARFVTAFQFPGVFDV